MLALLHYAYSASRRKTLATAIPAVTGSLTTVALTYLLGVTGGRALGKLLARLYDPPPRSILADGVDPRDIDPQTWCSRA